MGRGNNKCKGPEVSSSSSPEVGSKHFTTINALLFWTQLLFSFPLVLWRESQSNWDKAKEGRLGGWLESTTCLALNGKRTWAVSIQELCEVKAVGWASQTECHLVATVAGYQGTV